MSSTISELLRGVKRYELDSLETLEKYVFEQLQDGPHHYDLNANLAVLKLYLLYPEEAKTEVIEGILLKALMAFPATDFSLCMYQIPDKYQADLQKVVALAEQLEMAKFKAFWKKAQETEVLKIAAGWQSAAQQFIAGVIVSTYRSIDVGQLLELLNLSTKELDDLIKERGWTRSKEDSDVIIVNTATFESKKIVEKKDKEPTNMTLEQYRSLFLATSTA